MFVILTFTILFLISVKFLLQRTFFASAKSGFWKKHGILEIDASNIVSEKDILLGKKDITERDDHAYDCMSFNKDKYCGMVESPRPIILFRDLELIKKVFIKHFDNFTDRRPFFGAARDDSVLRKMLGNLTGDEWKGVRASVSPTFSSGKIRRMMEYINSVGLEWVNVLRERSEESKGHLIVDAYGIASNYTVDVIASAIFGLKAETVRYPNSIFSTMTHRLVNMTPFQNIKFTLSLRFPKLFRFFNIQFMDMEALSFFEKLLNKNLKDRMKHDETFTKRGIKQQQRNDFLQLLVEARKNELKSQNKWGNEIESTGQEPLIEGSFTNINNNNKEERKQYLSDKMMSAQCMGFFFAGFRTTSTFITFAMYSLALHIDAQEKLRKEVASVFKKDGSLDYDELGQLVYLEMVINEVLRKFPATLRLERLCVSEFSDPESHLYVPKGCIVGIPLHAIHNDRTYFKNPEKFDPEHFSAESKAQRNPYAFMPFGIGNRNCIGMRFALVESKAALAYLVHNFFIEPTANTPSKLIGKRINFQLVPPEDLKLKLVPIR